MDIGVPKETKDQEFRVGLSPSSVRGLTDQGHTVVVETQAGIGAGFTDDDYVQAGAKIVDTAAEAWDQAMVVKVKEPLSHEYDFIQKEQLLFTYLHLAADRTLTEQLIEREHQRTFARFQFLAQSEIGEQWLVVLCVEEHVRADLPVQL